MVNFEKPPQQVSPEALAEAEARYRDLKIREYNKELKDPKELDELLSIDFQAQLYDNPPIKGVFSPEAELARVKKAPKEQRREALAAFKDNLARQREAWAVCRIFIERCIEFNHDTPRNKLDAWVQRFGEQYGFTEQQKKIAERLLDGYHDNRQRVLRLSRRYPDNSKLVSELSGIKFDDDRDFDISIGPMSVDIETDGFNAERIYKGSKKVITKFPYMGFASLSEKHRAYFIILNRDIFRRGRPDREETTVHEHEHEKDRLFRAIFDRQGDILKNLRLLLRLRVIYKLERDTQAKAELLEAVFHLRRQKAFQDAKSEVIAMKKDRGDHYYGFFFEQDGSPYDYLAHLRDQNKGDIIWQETAKKVLVDEYKKIFERSLAAFDDLEKGGYTRDEVIAMLADKPFEQWPKTAKRLLEHKKSV